MPKTISIEITESQNYLPNAALHYKKDGTKIYKTVRLLETASMLSDIAYLKAGAARMHRLRNGSHPPVANERKAT